jgi:hypothetical protein
MRTYDKLIATIPARRGARFMRLRSGIDAHLLR